MHPESPLYWKISPYVTLFILVFELAETCQHLSSRHVRLWLCSIEGLHVACPPPDNARQAGLPLFVHKVGRGR
jgi:hypothetical protein